MMSVFFVDISLFCWTIQVSPFILTHVYIYINGVYIYIYILIYRYDIGSKSFWQDLWYHDILTCFRLANLSLYNIYNPSPRPRSGMLMRAVKMYWDATDFGSSYFNGVMMWDFEIIQPDHWTARLSKPTKYFSAFLLLRCGGLSGFQGLRWVLVFPHLPGEGC